MSSDKPSCFVIMPFSVRDHDIEKYNNDSNHWNEVYEGLIEAAVEAAGMRIERDDKDFSSRLVAEGIWKKIEASDVVLCDLSSLNPNVYLELGWALRADKKFVLIKDEHTDFSFDLNQFHTCVYSSKLKPSSLKADVRNLTRAIKETVGDEDRQYSMVKRMALTTAIESVPQNDIEANQLKLIEQGLSRLESKFSALENSRQKEHPQLIESSSDKTSMKRKGHSEKGDASKTAALLDLMQKLNISDDQN